MNLFDKICAVPAALLGVVLVVLGAIGLFAGCNANFTLPPLVGVLPFFIGWGIVRAVYIAWKSAPRPPAAATGPCSLADGPPASV